MIKFLIQKIQQKYKQIKFTIEIEKILIQNYKAGLKKAQHLQNLHKQSGKIDAINKPQTIFTRFISQIIHLIKCFWYG